MLVLNLFLLKCADTQTLKQKRIEGSVQQQAGKLRQQQYTIKPWEKGMFLLHITGKSNW